MAISHDLPITSIIYAERYADSYESIGQLLDRLANYGPVYFIDVQSDPLSIRFEELRNYFYSSSIKLIESAIGSPSRLIDLVEKQTEFVQYGSWDNYRLCTEDYIKTELINQLSPSQAYIVRPRKNANAMDPVKTLSLGKFLSLDDNYIVLCGYDLLVNHMFFKNSLSPFPLRREWILSHYIRKNPPNIIYTQAQPNPQSAVHLLDDRVRLYYALIHSTSILRLLTFEVSNINSAIFLPLYLAREALLVIRYDLPSKLPPYFYTIALRPMLRTGTKTHFLLQVLYGYTILKNLLRRICQSLSR